MPIAPRHPSNTTRTKVLLAALVLIAGLGSTGWPSIAAPAEAAPQTELVWKFEEGEELVYVQSMLQQMELPQGMGTSVTEVETTTRWQVLEVDADSNASVRIITDRIRMNVETPMGIMTVDSDNPSAGTGSPLEAITAMAGVGYTAVLDAHGSMVELRDVEEMQEALEGMAAGSPAAGMIGNMMNEETLRGGWMQSGYALPSEPVSVGSTWNADFTMPLPNVGTMNVTTDYEVTAIEGNLVTIGSTGVMRLVADAGPMPIDMDDSTMIGATTFDTDRGKVVATQVDGTLRMTVAAGAESMPLEAQMTILLELVDGS